MSAEPFLMRGLRLLAALTLGGLSLAVQAMAPIQHWTLDNGARVYFVPAHELPIVDLRVVFDAGSARDADHPGLAALTNGLLDQGAAGRSADEIASDLEGVGAELDSGSLRDMAYLSLRSLKDPRYLDKAVARYAEVLTQPDFPPTALERERQRMIVAWRQGRQDPGTLASEAFYAAVYGDHPYATPPGGNEKSLSAITRDEVRDHYGRYYVGANAVVAIVGDLDRAEAEDLAERTAGQLPTGRPAPELPKVEPLRGAGEVRIAFPSTQTHILIGAPGMRRGDPDYFPLYVGNQVLGGGGLVSVVSEEIREKRGLSYSAYSYFVPMHVRGPFQLGLQTRNSQVEEALKVARRTLAGFIDQGPTPERLEAAQKNITGGQPLQVDSNSDILDNVAMIGFYGLPLDYLDTFNDKVEAVDTAGVKAAFGRRLDPKRMITVIVGGGVEDSAHTGIAAERLGEGRTAEAP